MDVEFVFAVGDVLGWLAARPSGFVDTVVRSASWACGDGSLSAEGGKDVAGEGQTEGGGHD